MVLLDANEVLLIVLFVLLAVVIYFELRFMRSRNKDHIQRAMEKDEVYNSIANAKAIASALRGRGRDTKEAEQTINLAEGAYHRNNFTSAKGLAMKAREMLMNAPLIEMAPPAPEAPAPAEERRTVHEIKKLEPNMMESRFLIRACRDRMEERSAAGHNVSEAEEHLRNAERCFEEKRYDEALREGVRTRKLLDGEPVEAERPKDITLERLPPEKRCRKCSTLIQPGDMFCRKCGEPATGRNCEGCNAELDEGDLFCPKCGRRVRTPLKD